MITRSKSRTLANTKCLNEKLQTIKDTKYENHTVFYLFNAERKRLNNASKENLYKDTYPDPTLISYGYIRGEYFYQLSPSKITFKNVVDWIVSYPSAISLFKSWSINVDKIPII